VNVCEVELLRGAFEVIVGALGATVSITSEKVALELVFPEESVTFAETVQVPSTRADSWQLPVELDAVALQVTFD
jgi:hypothetical protein